MKWIALVGGLALVGFASWFALTGFSEISSVPACGDGRVVMGTAELFEKTPLAQASDLAKIDDPGKLQLFYPTETGFQWRQPTKRFCRALLHIKREEKGALYYAVSWQRKDKGVFFLEILGRENEGLRR